MDQFEEALRRRASQTATDPRARLAEELGRKQAPTLQQRSDATFGWNRDMDRAAFLPVGRDPDTGKLTFAWPKAGMEMGEKALLPGHVAQGGKYNMQDTVGFTLDYLLPSTMSKQPGRAGERPSPSDLRTMRKPAPQLAEKGSKAFGRIDESGAVVDPTKVMDFLIDSHGMLMKGNFKQRLQPQTAIIMNEMEKSWDQFSAGVPVTELHNWRKMIADELATKLKPSDRRLLTTLQRQTDQLMAGIKPTDLIGGKMDDFGKALASGNALWTAQSRVKRLDLAFARAQRSPSGFTKGLQNEFRKILNNESLARGFTDAQKGVMEDVIKSGLTKRTLQALGKFGYGRNILGGLAGSAAGSVAGSSAGAALGGGPGAAIGGALGGFVPPMMAAGAQKMLDAGTMNSLNTLRGMASTGWSRPSGMFDNFTAAMPPLLSGAMQPEDEKLVPNEDILRGLLMAPGVI